MSETPSTPDAVAGKSLVDFYLDIIRSGEKYPAQEWEVAAERYAGPDDPARREHLDAFRGQVDTQKSYLDQLEGVIRVTAAPGMAEDEAVQKQAQCAERLVQYAFRELCLRRVCGRALLSALINGAGAAVDAYDERRTMPTMRWLHPLQVAWDATCQGDVGRAGWVAFYEWVSPDVLWAQSEGALDLEKLRHAANRTPQTHLGQVRRDSAKSGSSGELDRRCCLWRFFGRNEFAIYSDKPADAPVDGKGAAEFSRFKVALEPRRYLELVDGYDEPLADEPDWPAEFALDWDAWPVRWLTFNEDLEHVAGFTDWRHVQRANDANEELARALTKNGEASLSVKFLASSTIQANRETLEEFLKTGNAEKVLDGMVDAQGNPLLTPMQTVEFRRDLLELAKYLQDKSDGAARIDEILRGMQGKPEQTATEVSARQEAMQTMTTQRLRRYEEFEEEVARRWLEMALATMPRYSTLNVASIQRLPNDPQGEPILVYEPRKGVPWEEVAAILAANPGSEIKKIGVDAIVGAALAEFWPSGMPLAVIRRNVRIYVDAGSTTQQARTEQAAAMSQAYLTLFLPLYQATGRMDLACSFVKLIAAKMGLDEAAALVPDVQAPVPGLPGTVPMSQPELMAQ